MSKHPKTKLTLEAKIEKEFPDFCVEVQGLGVDGLNTRLVNYAKHAQEIDESQESDTGLQDAKDTVKEISAPYRDSKKAVKMKMRYIVNMIREKGGK